MTNHPNIEIGMQKTQKQEEKHGIQIIWWQLIKW